MKTTKDEIELLRHHANVVSNRDQGALILSALDDLDEAEARAERLQVICDKMSTALHEMRTSYRQNQHAQEWVDFMIAAISATGGKETGK